MEPVQVMKGFADYAGDDLAAAGNRFYPSFFFIILMIYQPEFSFMIYYANHSP